MCPPHLQTLATLPREVQNSDFQLYSTTIQYNDLILIFAPSYSNYHEGAMTSCNMPWWTIQSWVGWRNWQQTETCRWDQAANCSRSLDPRRRNREAHSGPSRVRGMTRSQWTAERRWVWPDVADTGMHRSAVRRWHLLTCEHNLNWMRWRTGSQCRSSHKMSVMWSNLRLPVMRRADTFITNWSGCRLVVVVPYSN